MAVQPSEAHCSLVQQLSGSACVFGESFFCTSSVLWVRKGCRGFFRCGPVHGVVACGPHRGPNCTCPADHDSTAVQHGRHRHVRGCQRHGAVWAGTSTHSRDALLPSLQSTAALLLSSHLIQRVTINFWDGRKADGMPSTTSEIGGIDIRYTAIAGAKGLFFKRVFTASATLPFELIYLFDADMQTSPVVFPLAHFLSLMRLTRASVMQPSITMREPRTAPPRGICTPQSDPDSDACFGKRGVRSTDWPHLRVKTWSGACVIETVQAVELQATVFRRDAWSYLHAAELMSRPDSLLSASDNGLSVNWCGGVRAAAAGLGGRRSCVITRHVGMVHSDQRQIETFNLTSVIRRRYNEYSSFARDLTREDKLQACLTIDQLHAMASQQSMHQARLAGRAEPCDA